MKAKKKSNQTCHSGYAKLRKGRRVNTIKRMTRPEQSEGGKVTRKSGVGGV